MSDITCAGCKEQTPAKYISEEYISDGFCGLCCICVSKRLDARIAELEAKCNQRRDDLKQARDILDERFKRIAELEESLEGRVLEAGRYLDLTREQRSRIAELEAENNWLSKERNWMSKVIDNPPLPALKEGDT